MVFFAREVFVLSAMAWAVSCAPAVTPTRHGGQCPEAPALTAERLASEILGASAAKGASANATAAFVHTYALRSPGRRVMNTGSLSLVGDTVRIDYANGNRVTVDERFAIVSSGDGVLQQTPTQESDYGLVFRVLKGKLAPGLQALPRASCGRRPFYVLLAEAPGPTCRNAVFIVDAATFELRTVLLNPGEAETSRFDLTWSTKGAKR